MYILNRVGPMVSWSDSANSDSVYYEFQLFVYAFQLFIYAFQQFVYEFQLFVYDFQLIVYLFWCLFTLSAVCLYSIHWALDSLDDFMSQIWAESADVQSQTGSLVPTLFFINTCNETKSFGITMFCSSLFCLQSLLGMSSACPQLPSSVTKTL